MMATPKQISHVLRIGFLLLAGILSFLIGALGISAAAKVGNPQAVYVLGVCGTLFIAASILMLHISALNLFSMMTDPRRPVVSPTTL